MPSYTLNITFTAQDLKTIAAAGERVTILKQVDTGTPVAWVAFEPFEGNTVTWTDNYALYASTTQIQNGALINEMSSVDAAPQVNYPFSGGAFGAPQPDGTLKAGQYEVTNNFPDLPALTFGLAQSIEVNGAAPAINPINAVLVPASQHATFIPLEVVTVFMEAEVQSSMVITEVAGTPIVLTFGNGVSELTISYNAATGGFVQTSSLSAPQGDVLAKALTGTISVFQGQTKLGDGSGTIDTGAHTASITSWGNKAGLVKDRSYTLKMSGKQYSGTCTATSSTSPVATFDKVE